VKNIPQHWKKHLETLADVKQRQMQQ